MRTWLGGLLTVGAIGLAAAGSQNERTAVQTIERVGGCYRVEPRFGLDCLGVVVEVYLAECSPSCGDLAEIKRLQHLRVLDLSRTPIGDRELLQLVDSACQTIVVPDGQTSAEARSMFPEYQIAVGIGISEFAMPGVRATSLPADVVSASIKANHRAEGWAARRALPKRQRRRA